MENNEKRPKRPRISESRVTLESQDTNRPMAENAQAEDNEQRPYRPYNRPQQGGYNRPYNEGYNRPYNNPYNRVQDDGVEGQAEGERPQQGYTPRPYNNYHPQQHYNQGGYGNNNRQGGYGNNNRQGGYGNNNRQGGYGNNNRQQGGYGNNNRQGGYGNNSRQGGYGNNNRQQGGYGNNNRQQGGYNNQGGYGNNNNRKNKYNNRPQQGGYNNKRKGQSRYDQEDNPFPGKGKSFTPRPKRIEYEMPIPDPNELIRLNKFMANSGVCSRREADEYIQQGLVKVNGKVVTELGTKICHSDVVEYDDKVVALESKCYILLNKPKDCVTTSDDPNGRTTVMDLIKGACTERVYPVGRLDRNTTGVLLLTNDGDLASKLTHPKYVKKKIYHVWTDKDVSEEDMQRIADGIELEDGEIHADAISYATETDRNQIGIEIHSGRNRIVRRIFESLGYHVTKLDRVYFAGLTKKNLPRGRWRYLTQQEVNFLKMGSFE